VGDRGVLPAPSVSGAVTTAGADQLGVPGLLRWVVVLAAPSHSTVATQRRLARARGGVHSLLPAAPAIGGNGCTAAPGGVKYCFASGSQARMLSMRLAGEGWVDSHWGGLPR